MSTKTQNIMKTTFTTLFFSACLFLTNIPEASAERSHYRPHFEQQRYAYRHVRAYPRWLRRNYGFRHWYERAGYRYGRRMSWNRLYDLYCYDLRDRRRGRQSFSFGYDNGYYYPSRRYWRR